MKKFILSFFLLSLLPSAKLISQVAFPDPSPLQTISQNFGMSAVEITYSRPGMKGRKMVGYTEPYDSVWRTGANAPTRIRFFSPVEIKGNKIDSGTYVLYTIPTAKDWTVIINKGVTNWGSDQYKRSEDVCRFTLTPERKRKPVETLAFQFENVKGSSCDITLQWEDWMITIPVIAPIREDLRKQIEANLKSDKPGYWLAAQFYYEYDSNNAKALEMINAAIKANEAAGRKPYWQYHYKARILKDLGRKQEAMDAAMLSSKHAKEHGNRNNYIRLSEDLISALKK